MVTSFLKHPWRRTSIARFLGATITIVLIAIYLYRPTILSESGEALADFKDRLGEESPHQRYCRDTFGDGYLDSFPQSFAEYCSDPDKASLTCFDHMVDPKQQRNDAFCLGVPAVYDAASKRFGLGCAFQKAPKNQHGVSVKSPFNLAKYWYSTGPSWIFWHFFKFAAPASGMTSDALHSGMPLPTLFLVKREIANFNLWHNLMEVMSAVHTDEILRRSAGITDLSMTTARRKSTHVVLLDEEPDGPFLSLWQLITPNPVLRLNNVTEIPALHTSKVIVPLPGGANPFWQGDWVDVDCGKSSLLRSFSDRVLSLYKIPRREGRRPLMVTIIDRREKRRLIHQDQLISALKSRIGPGRASVQVVDFATLPLAEQVALAHRTDVLVGVHGAGLAHAMFIPQKSAIVEFMPFNLDHRGYRNMARMLDHQHFGAKTIDSSGRTNAKDDWQEDDVVVATEDWLREIDNAIGAVEKARGNG